jgi:hypothetical protein
MKLLAGIIGGLLMAILGATVVTLGGASRPAVGGSYGAVAFVLLWIVGLAVALRAPTGAKAWRRLLITSGVLSFLLPLSAIVFTGSQVAGTLEKGGEYAGAAAAGAAIGGGLISGIMGVVGFFLGAVFLVIGLLTGRDKQVVLRARTAARPEQDLTECGSVQWRPRGVIHYAKADHYRLHRAPVATDDRGRAGV